MTEDLLITQMVNRKQMQELIYIFNKQTRPVKKEGRNDFANDSSQTE